MSIYQVKKFKSVNECNEWLEKQKNTIMVISGSLAVGPSGETLSSPILITFEDLFCKTKEADGQ